MSQIARVKTACPACGAPIEGELGIVISTMRTPEWRDRILDRSFNVLPCEACGARSMVERTVALIDFDRFQWVHAYPRWALRHWRDLARVTQDQFRLAVVTHAPPFVARDADRWLVRTVFGYEALREKLVLWEAQLDERAVEGTKLAILQAHPRFLNGDVVLEGVDGETVRWTVRRPAPAPGEAEQLAALETVGLTPEPPPRGHLGMLGEDPFWGYQRFLVEPTPADPLAFDLQSRRYGFGGGDMRPRQDELS